MAIPSGEFLVVAQRQRIGGQSFGRQLARIASRIGQREQFIVARGQGQRNPASGIFEVEMLGGFGCRFMEEIEAQIVHGALLYGTVAAAGHGLRTQTQGQVGSRPYRVRASRGPRGSLPVCSRVRETIGADIFGLS
ncbi:MAG: hypothetical protein ACLR8Y_10090 [Alistipes indistinctus]